MSLASILQISSFVLSLIGSVLALYVLALNFWNTSNRHLSLLFFIFASNNLFTGLILDPSVVTRESAIPLTYGLGATTTPFQVILLLLTVVLLKPEWLRGRWRWVWWPLYALLVLPGLLTLLDVSLGTQLWYTGLDADYAGGFVQLADYANGSLAVPIRIISYAVLSLVSLLIAFLIAWRDKRVSPETRRLAWLLFVSQLVASAVQFGLGGISRVLVIQVASTVYAVAYGYAAFQQMVSERRLQRGRLQVRLVLLVLAIAVPLLIAVAFLLTNQAARQLNQDANEQLRLANVSLKGKVDIWLNQNTLVVQQLAAQPDIVSMDPVLQKPILVETDRVYDYLFLVQTTDLNGMNVARSDDGELQDYSDRIWFQGGRSGALVTMQPLVSRTTGRPALNLATPIRNSSGDIVGVASIVAELDEISAQVQASRVGQTGLAYVIAPDNRVVAHPDPAYSSELRDLSEYPAVQLLRQGRIGSSATFMDEQGIRWRAHLDVLDGEIGQGWGVVVQQQESEVRAALQGFQNISTVTVLLGAGLMGIFVAFAMRQAFQPVNTLTSTVTAITAGDLTREAPVESEDELGTLARAFNSMTAQLRDLIGGLEDRVASRTADLEERSRYLAASAEVGRAAASILDAEQLAQQVVTVIRERFELYYVALFTVDQSAEQAVLRAGTGEAGRARLARGYQLPLEGQSSMIAWCIANDRPRIAQEADRDEVRFVSPELPDTRSEVALPLRSRGQVIGALSLQSDRPNVFDETVLAVLQVMADQVAVALDNARLFAESESALEQSRRAYGELSQQAWTQLLRSEQGIGYRYTQQEVTSAEDTWQPEMVQAVRSGQRVVEQSETESVLAVPLKVRDQVLGVVHLRKKSPGKTWTEEENVLIETLTEQLGVALESARLYQDTRRRAAQERLVGEATGRIRESLDIETVLKTTASEIRQALDLETLVIRLATPEMDLAEPGIDDVSGPV
ncbi:MAG: GAF domain-containing protein [Anaerolineae bacterium]|nr:GAF domain-containing protein [Anaerolineae bacterium]